VDVDAQEIHLHHGQFSFHFVIHVLEMSVTQTSIQIQEVKQPRMNLVMIFCGRKVGHGGVGLINTLLQYGRVQHLVPRYTHRYQESHLEI